MKVGMDGTKFWCLPRFPATKNSCRLIWAPLQFTKGRCTVTKVCLQCHWKRFQILETAGAALSLFSSPILMGGNYKKTLEKHSSAVYNRWIRQRFCQSKEIWHNFWWQHPHIVQDCTSFVTYVWFCQRYCLLSFLSLKLCFCIRPIHAGAFIWWLLLASSTSWPT